mmetsp:Transcript_81620/g.141867  ORF Transcript_81620/g.141867 Transcript_81620/m.141867 type:complete len:233 (+) Transcript_81620:115-813(+)
MSILKSLFGTCTGFGGTGENPQLLILGLEGAGKTTLLYRLKLGNQWKSNEMKKALKEMREPNKDGIVEDPGYHYEEFNWLHSCGIWEVPGTPAMRQIWSCFYRTIKIHGVIFVVNGFTTPPDEEQVYEAKKHLHHLMNEDELRNACFAIVVNTPDSKNRDGAVKEDKSKVYEDNPYLYKLSLNELHPSCQWRTKIFYMCVSELKGESDHEWGKVKDFIKQVLNNNKGFGMKL